MRRRPRRKDEQERHLEAVWRAHARQQKACAVCGATSGLDGHHVLPKERIKRFAVAVGLDPVRLLWDVSNMMPLCRRCHDRHHTGFLRVRRADLPVEAVLFARSLDLEWVLERLYT